ncbi:MAG: 4'-phosphopantetheinyl transferase superfamily protein [Oscillospiraceae bacterium]|nr:4'-phosphopantetheinyl transferase superfamily protein [Oscillospiraceae bacterium]
MVIDFSASVVTGSGVRARIESARTLYSEGCKAYFDDILSRRGKVFADSACGFLLLDSLLQKHKIDRAELSITLGGDGRPRTNRADLDFSVSHSEGCAMCVVAIGEGANVGVDVQRERPYSLEKMVELARTFMNEEEFGVFSKPTARKSIPMNSYDKDVEDFIQKNREFYTAWTRRESYTKRIGSDIFDNLKTARIYGEHYRDGVISACGERYYYSICAPANAFAEEEEPAEVCE